MQLRINFKLILGLLVAIFVAAAAVYGVHQLQVRRNAGVVLREANEAEQQGDLDKAAKLLSRYLGYRPRDTDARARLGLVIEKQDSTQHGKLRTLLILEHVLRSDPSRTSLRRKVAETAIDLGRFDDARAHLRNLLGSSSNDGELEFLMGRCEEGAGRFEAASKLYTSAIVHAPKQIDAYVRLARVQRVRLSKLKDADLVMDKMVAANAKEFRAYLERGRYRQEFGLPDAAGDIAHAKELAPDDPDVMLAMASIARTQAELAATQKELERGIKLHPKNRVLYLALVKQANRARQPKEALKWVEAALAALPDKECAELKLIKVELLTSLGRLQEASDAVDRLRDQPYPAEMLDFFKARVLAAQSDWHGARTLLEHCQAKLKPWPNLLFDSHLVLARCYEQFGDVERQFSSYLQALALDPLSIPARLGKAGTLMAKGKVEEAIAEYRGTVALAPEVRFVLAKVLLDKNLRLPETQRRWGELEQLQEEAARATPASPDLPILQAQLLAARGDAEKAKTLLEKARDQRPNNLATRLSLSLLNEREGKFTEALATLDEADRVLGDRIDLRLARIAYWSRHRGSDSTKALEKLAEEAKAAKGEDRRRLLDALAAANIRIGNLERATQLWRQMASENRFDLRSRLLLVDLALQSNDEAALTPLIEEIRAIEGDEGTLWRYGKVRVLLRQAMRGKKSAIAEARPLLKQIALERPSWSRVPLAEAEFEELSGNPEDAIKDLQRAIDLGAREPLAFRRLIQLLSDRQRYSEANQVLQRLQEQSPGLDDLDHLAAELSLRTQDSAHALELARKAVPTDSKDYRDLLWLGQILWATGQREQAGPVLQRAVALGENSPQTWLALVRYLVATGKMDEAKAATEKARTKLPAEQAPLVLAYCYEMLGKPDDARAQYKAALTAKPKDAGILHSAAIFELRSGRIPETESYLRKLIALSATAPSDAAWARRMLAVILASGGNHQKMVEALSILSPSDQSQVETVDDLRAKASVLAAQQTRGERREALRLMEQVAQRTTLIPSDQFLLAQLYEAEGDARKAREHMLLLLSSDKKNPTYLIRYINTLMRQRAFDEATMWLATLESVEPGTPRTLSMKVRLLNAQGKVDQASALVRSYAERPDAQLLLCAALFEETGSLDEAEVLYRKLDTQAKRPEDTMILARYLGRRHRVKEALDVCERAWRTCPPEAVGSLCLVVLYSAKTQDDQFGRVDKWLDEALRKKPDSISLEFDRANLRVLQGRADDAEAIYRRLQARHKTSGAPLNNLAWLLALREDRSSEALTLINQAIAIEGPVPDLLDTRAVVYMTLGQSENAIKDLDDSMAVNLTPTSAFHMAQAQLQAKNRPAAVAAWKTAKGAGLLIDNLHPLEHETYRKLEADLGRD